VFCSQRCRQWNWVAKERRAELALNEHELVVARDELDRLHDDLYVLACAIEDVERDRVDGGRRTVQSLNDNLRWLLQAAEPLRDRTVGSS
jgi:hypothetical protein